MADKDTIPASPGDVPPGYKGLVGSIKTMFDDSPEFSDFTLKCDGQTWHIHKNIVAARSDVFKKAFLGSFKEGREGVMTLADDDKGIVNEMLRYIYTADYQDEHTAEQPCFTPMLLSVHIHTIADKYNIPALAELANAKVSERAVKEWNTKDFASAIEEMYITAPHSKKVMQTAAVDIAVEHAEALYGGEMGNRLQEVASKTPEFASQLAAKLISRKKQRKGDTVEYTFQCRSSRCLSVYITTMAPPGGNESSGGYLFCPHCGDTESLRNGVLLE